MKLALQYFAEEIPQLESEKTFTQEDVNRIVTKRLAEEKQKQEAEMAKCEAALKQREFELEAKAILKDKELPDTLLSALKGNDIETFSKSVAALKAYENSKIETHFEGSDRGIKPGFLSHGNSIRQAMGLK